MESLPDKIVIGFQPIGQQISGQALMSAVDRRVAYAMITT